MCKAARDKELTAVVGRKRCSLPMSKGGTAWTQVNRHIKDFALDYAHKLGLRMGNLKVQATQDALGRTGLVVLHKLGCDAAGDKVGALVGLGEIAALIAKCLGINQDHTIDRGMCECEIAADD